MMVIWLATIAIQRSISARHCGARRKAQKPGRASSKKGDNQNNPRYGLKVMPQNAVRLGQAKPPTPCLKISGNRGRC